MRERTVNLLRSKDFLRYLKGEKLHIAETVFPFCGGYLQVCADLLSFTPYPWYGVNEEIPRKEVKTMRKRICLLTALLLLSALLSGCQGPHMLGEFMLDNFYSEELKFPIVERSMDGAVIPCLNQERKSFMDFPARNMTILMFSVEKAEPYWAMAVRNQGHTDLSVEISHTLVTVSPGCSRWIYCSDASVPGDYNVIFHSQQDGLLSGSVELWQSENLTELVPVYRMTAKILKVLDGYFLAEPIQTSLDEETVVKFYGETPVLAGEEYNLHEGSIVEIGYSGPFLSSSPYYLDGIQSVRILSPAPVEALP